MDVFIEKIVKRKKTTVDYVFMGSVIIAAIMLSFILLPILKRFTIVLLPIVIFVVYYLAKSRNIEFEYSVTNGELDIDRIIDQKKRKRVFSADCRNFDIIAKVGSQYYTEDVKKIKNVFNAASSFKSEDLYFIQLNYRGVKTVIYFEPNEKMIDAFKIYIKSKVF
ncbi:MAG TPA: hypothetical protein VF941_01165 [Clostridia bacterium]